MRLRADTGEIDIVLADWWQEFSLASDELREDMVDQVREEQQKKQRAPRVHKMPLAKDSAAQPATPDALTDMAPPVEGTLDDAAPKKRRRRRRTGASSSGGDSMPDVSE